MNPANPKVLAGLKRLEDQAGKQAKDAELATQRGEKDVCSRWKRITKITRGDSEIHKTAVERIRTRCS